MATSKNMNGMFTDEQLALGKLLVMKPQHGVAKADMERLTRASLTEVDPSATNLEAFVQHVINNSLGVMGSQPWDDCEIYVAKGESPNSAFLRIAEPEAMIGAYELDADGLKSLHNASISHAKISQARAAMLWAKRTHNELVTFHKRHRAFKSFSRRTNALNEASHCYGVNTLRKLSKEVKACMSKTW
jgi:hypothetical protein